MESREQFSENLKKYMVGRKQARVCRDLDIPVTSFNSWMKGKAFPRPERIKQLCDYFGCTESQLLGEQTIDINKEFSELTEEQQKQIIMMLSFFKEMNKDVH